MISILLIISFLLHLIFLVIIYQLYQQIGDLRSERSRDTEVLLSRFLDEIKQENRQLQQQLQQSNKKEQNATTIQAQAEYVPKQEMADGKERTNDHFDFPPIPIATEDKVETSIESQVFQMHQKGISTETIARQLNRGKTEVELLIKLQDPHSK